VLEGVFFFFCAKKAQLIHGKIFGFIYFYSFRIFNDTSVIIIDIENLTAGHS